MADLGLTPQQGLAELRKKFTDQQIQTMLSERAAQQAGTQQLATQQGTGTSGGTDISSLLSRATKPSIAQKLGTGLPSLGTSIASILTGKGPKDVDLSGGETVTGDPLIDRLIKQNTLITGSPEFKREQETRKFERGLEDAIAKESAIQAFNAEKRRLAEEQEAGMIQRDREAKVAQQDAIINTDPTADVGSVSGTFQRIPKGGGGRKFNPDTGQFEDVPIEFGFREDPNVVAQRELAQAEAEGEQESRIGAKKTLSDDELFLTQLDRAFTELEQVFPNIGATGIGGFFSRKLASVGESVDAFPETSTFLDELLPKANLMARTIEGAKVTDKDREIYAQSFANVLTKPTASNARLASNALLKIHRTPTANIVPHLYKLSKLKTKVLQQMVENVYEDVPGMRQAVQEFEILELEREEAEIRSRLGG